MSLCRCGRYRERQVAGASSSQPGRGFYSCSCPNKFEWEGDGAPAVSASGPACKCGVASVQRAQKKEGPNRGRKFWCCAKPKGCGFFEWQAAGSPSKDAKYASPKKTPKPTLPGYANYLSDWSELAAIQQMFTTDAAETMTERAHDTMQVVGAWRITNDQRKEKYDAAFAS